MSSRKRLNLAVRLPAQTIKRGTHGGGAEHRAIRHH